MPLATRSGSIVRNGASTQGRLGDRLMRKPNRRTKSKDLPPATTIALPPTPPDRRGIPRTRRRRSTNEKIDCSHFGLHRQDVYPMYFFCENCTFYDADSVDPTRSNLIKRNSQKYRCHHTSWVRPTQLYVPHHQLLSTTRKEYVGRSTSMGRSRKRNKLLHNEKPIARRKSNKDESSEEESSIEAREQSSNEELSSDSSDDESQRKDDLLKMEEMRVRTECMIQRNSLLKDENQILTETVSYSRERVDELMKVNSDLNDELNEMSDKLIQVQKELVHMQIKEHKYSRKLSRLRYASKKMNQKLDAKTYHDATNVFKQAINKLSKERNRSSRKLATNVLKELWEEEFLEGMFIEEIVNKVREYFRTNIFNAHNLLKAMDMKGGQLSMTGIDILRSIETKGEKYCRQSIFPSTAAIKRTTSLVDTYVKEIVPYEIGILPGGGEFAKFQPKDIVKLMIRAYQLEEESNVRSIKINQAIDGAQISKRQHHTTIGFKMADKAAKDPRTGELIYASKNETTLQSKHHCFPTMIVMKKETTELYQHFTTVMEEMHDLTDGPKAAALLGTMPIIAPLDSDMSATWKLFGRGGAMKVEKCPCHICDIHDTELEDANLDQCATWCKQFRRPSDWNCYHKNFLDSSTVSNLRTKMSQYESEICKPVSEIKKIQQQSYINCKEDPRGVRKDGQYIDPRSIFFNFEAACVSEATRSEYNYGIINDLVLRRLPVDGNLAERRTRLHNRLLQEFTYNKLNDTIIHADAGADKNFLLLMDYVPCILHMENRTGLKILFCILQEGLVNVLAKKIYRDISTIPERIRCLLRNVEELCNNRIFGTPTRPTSWQIPFNMKERKFEDITLDNNRTRQLINRITIIIDICIQGERRINQWKKCVEQYICMFKILRRKEDFSDDDVFEFQEYADDFYQLWMELAGREGITNYFHLIGSGHVSDYLFHYRNLYVHSQQGWEAFNSFLKVFFFRRTTRGGGNGDGSRVRQIARWLGRRLIWMAGDTFEKMNTYLITNDLVITGKKLRNEQSIQNMDCSSSSSKSTSSDSSCDSSRNSSDNDSDSVCDVHN